MKVAASVASLLLAQPRLPASAPTLDRRVLLHGCFSGVSLALAGAAAPAMAKDKGYLTLSEYNALKAQEKADEVVYGKFAALSGRAAQTSEFDALATKDDLTGLSKLALAWDASIRKGLMEEASTALTGADKERGAALNKAVLNDLKGIDKLAKAGDKEAVPEASLKLRAFARRLDPFCRSPDLPGYDA